jgi:glucose-1-phosphate thymidylyltransferase
MKAIVLAAGYATRLFPLTRNFPKALLEVGGIPMLTRLINQLLEISQIDQIHIVTNQAYYQHFENWLRDYGSDRIVLHNDGTTFDGDKLGAIGDMQFVIERAKIDDDTIVIAGDNLLDFSLTGYYDKYVEVGRKPLLLGCVYEDKNALKSFAVAEVDETGRVLSLIEKPQEPKGNLAIFALYGYPASVLGQIKTYLDEGNSPDAPGHFPEWLYKRQDVYVYQAPGHCYDVGTHEHLAMVRELFSRPNESSGG